MLKLLKLQKYLVPTRRNIAVGVVALICAFIFWKALLGMIKLVFLIALIGGLAYAGWRLFLRPSSPSDR
jgi:hypothetical protein